MKITYESLGDYREIEIISGFLGAGKTTLLNQYLSCLSAKTAVIENEFGETGIDGALINENTPVKEIIAGCICCSLSLDFRRSIKEASFFLAIWIKCVISKKLW